MTVDHPIADIIWAEVIADFEPIGDFRENQLKLTKGEIVCVLERHPSGWWGGHKSDDEFTAWFPEAHVQPIDDDALDGDAVPCNKCRCCRARGKSPPRALERDNRLVATPMQVGESRRLLSAEQHASAVERYQEEIEQLKAELQMERQQERKREQHADMVNRYQEEVDRLRADLDVERQRASEVAAAAEQSRTAAEESRAAAEQSRAETAPQQRLIFEQQQELEVWRHAEQTWFKERQRLQEDRQRYQEDLSRKEARIRSLEFQEAGMAGSAAAPPNRVSQVAHRTSSDGTSRTSPTRMLSAGRLPGAGMTVNVATAAAPTQPSPDVRRSQTSTLPAAAMATSMAASTNSMASLPTVTLSGGAGTPGAPPGQNVGGAGTPTSSGGFMSARRVPSLSHASVGGGISPSPSARGALVKPPALATAVVTASHRPPSPRPWAFAAPQSVPAALPSYGGSSGHESQVGSQEVGPAGPVRALVSAFERKAQTPTPASVAANSLPPRGADPSPGRQPFPTTGGGSMSLVCGGRTSLAFSHDVRPHSAGRAISRTKTFHAGAHEAPEFAQDIAFAGLAACEDAPLAAMVFGMAPMGRAAQQQHMQQHSQQQMSQQITQQMQLMQQQMQQHQRSAAFNGHLPASLPSSRSSSVQDRGPSVQDRIRQLYGRPH